jgi:LysR family glycine cleavage system transcriptional activator
MLSPFLFREDLASGRLLQPFDLCVGDGKTYWLCYAPAPRNAAKITAFATWIQSALADDLATIGTNRIEAI